MFGLDSILSKLLDWRFILLVVVLALAGFGYYKFHSLVVERDKALADNVVLTTNNATLKDNQSKLEEANKQNAVAIEQLQHEKEVAMQTVADLTAAVQKSNATYAGINRKLSELQAPTTKLTPYFSTAIREIQLERSRAMQPSKEPAK